MSLKKSVLSVVTAATLAAGTLTSVSTSATAHGWRNSNYGGNHAYAQRNNPWNGGRGHVARGYNSYDGDYGYRHHRNHEGRALAIGAFATILGIAIASQAAHAHDYQDND